MSAAGFAEVIARGGLPEVGYAVAVTAPWIILGLGLAMLAGRWFLRRGSRRLPLQPLPPAEVGDDTVALFGREPDIRADSVTDAIRRILEEDGRG